ncbi:hypothetical protein HZH68_016569 [Vespula germanica]|uniref:Uncharacterized protein n=1 Tax=Vespula germanica TaxID=30212 RepID=A0A834J5Z0_VESGE|nr:hypothetical protein HZH68_016569 [Vespula germanica]
MLLVVQESKKRLCVEELPRNCGSRGQLLDCRFILEEIFAPLGDFENLSPCVDLEFFASSGDFEDISPRVDLEIFAGCRIRASINEDLMLGHPGMDHRGMDHRWIDHRENDHHLDSALSQAFDNLSPREDLEIFADLDSAFSRDFDNLSSRVDLEIFTPLRDFDNLSP